MRLRRRLIIRMVLLTVLGCVSLSVIVTVIARGRALDLVVEAARNQAQVVAYGAQDSPQSSVEHIVAGNDDVQAVYVYDVAGNLIAEATVPGFVPPSDQTLAGLAEQAQEDVSPVALESTVVTSIGRTDDEPTIYAVVTMSSERAAAILWQNIAITSLATTAFAVLAAMLAWVSARHLAEPIALMDRAARDLERGTYDSSVIEPVLHRDDELGLMARRFDAAASQAVAREQALQERVVRLQVQIDEEERRRHVAEITSTDAFADLERRAREMRARRARADDRPAPAAGPGVEEDQ